MEKVKSFFKVLLITIIVTRLWTISLFYLFGNESEFTNRIVNDSFHHYQIGILLMVAGYLFRKMFKSKVVIPVGLGIFLEEWPVFLNDLGLKTNDLYHSKIDFISVVVLVTFGYFLFLTLIKYKKERLY